MRQPGKTKTLYDFETNNLRLDYNQFIDYLWREVREIGTQKTAAEKWGLSKQYLNDILHRRREPGIRLLTQLGFERRTFYLRK